MAFSVELNVTYSHHITAFQKCSYELPDKKTISMGENKDADQLCSNCTADHRLCFRCTDSIIPLLLKSKI